MRAAIYARISRDRNGEQLGVTRQREDCTKLCADRDWKIADTFTDNDVSAYSGTPRPGYARLLDAVRAGTIDVVVAWHPDRLHRSPRELEDFIDAVEQHRVEVATIRSGQLDLTTASGRMTARIVGSVARHESEQKSERVRRALEQRARSGKRLGGGRPFGYEPDKVTVRDREADAIRDAAVRVMAGEPWHRIVCDWNADGLRPPQGAAEWSPTNWRRMMVAPTLAGLAHYRGEVIGDGDWPAILDRSTWEQVVAKLAPKKRAGRPAVRLLSGLARCGRCGGPLYHASNAQGDRYYRCTSAPGKDGCGRLRVTAGPAEELTRDVVIAALAGEQLADARRHVAGDDREQADAAATLADVEERREQVAGDYADGTISRREWIAARERLDARERDAQRVLARDERNGTLSGLPADEATLQTTWEASDVAWRRAVLGAVVEAIEVAPPARQTNRFDPDRLTFRWRV